MDQPKKVMPQGRQFEKGKSGNPSGRPPEPKHVKELARAWTEEAISTLAKIMTDDSQPAAARSKSAEVLLNRAWGTPESTATINVNQKDVRELSTAEILAALAAHGITAAPDGQAVSPELH